MTTPRRSLAIIGLGALCLQACQSTAQDAASNAAVAESDAAPLYLSGEYDSTIGYLLAAYDKDGNGAISREEYDRDDETWERLDRNKDGVVDPADYQASGGRENRMKQFAAQFMISKYFQVDEQAERVTLGELEASFAAYDTNADDTVAVAEFTCAFEVAEQVVPGDELYSRMLGDIDPWQAILAGVDEDKDGALAAAELETFFLANAEESEQGEEKVWIAEAPRRRSRGTEGGPRVEAEDGAMEGALAPDFTLSSPDGSETYTLSSFAGDKPVALIFGSYT